MIDVQQAHTIVLNHAVDLGTETVAITEAYGRILREDIFSSRDFPPFDRVAMDGIAIHYAAYSAGRRHFDIESIQAAGQEARVLQDSMKCIEVMTGAVLPRNTSTVIPYEDLVKDEGGFKVNAEINEASNIHFKGSDLTKGKLLLQKGTFLKSPMIGILASEGKTQLKVARNPVVALISSGDEIVDIDVVPGDHQIRRSNTYMLQAELKKWNIQPYSIHITDDKKSIHSVLDEYLSKCDVLILSGGVSKGKFDHIPAVLEDMGVTKLFHRIAQRPGKPFWFGQKEEKLVFAFPGNPASTLLCYKKYFESWLEKSLVRSPCEQLKIRLTESVEFKPDLTYFPQVRIVVSGNELVGSVIKGRGSGDMTSLAKADGFAELPRGRSLYSNSELFNFLPL